MGLPAQLPGRRTDGTWPLRGKWMGHHPIYICMTCRRRPFSARAAARARCSGLAGRRMGNGFVSRQKSANGAYWQKCRRPAVRCNRFRLPVRRTRLNPTGRRTANGSRSRGRRATSTFAWCRRTAVCRRPCWSAARIPPGRRTRGRWCLIIPLVIARCYLCLTFSPNNTRIVCERPEVIPSPLGRNSFPFRDRILTELLTKQII